MPSSQAGQAERIARRAHAGQVDKAGADYTHHLEAVASGVEGDAPKTVAWLHDTIEDTGVTADDLLDMGVSREVVEAVEAMTHRDGEDYFDYIARVRENPLARAVKLSDLTHNSDLSRLPEVGEADLRRVAKYRRAMEMLA